MNNKARFFIIASASFLLVITITMFFTTDIAHTTSGSTTEFKPTIVIDAGHGGEDSGAISNDGNILEKNINLNISLLLKDLFLTNGFDVVMTRDTDISLHNPNATSHKKHSDLQNRVDIFNSSQNNIVISIHQNKFTQEKYSGTQIFYSSNCDKSSALAEKVKSSVVTLLQPDNQRECKVAGSEIFVLNNARVPAIMVECGFLSNEAEAQKLNNNDYQSKLAYCIYLGFLEYYYTNY